MREHALPHGRIVLNDRRAGRKSKAGFGRFFSARRISMTAVLGIAGLAMIGVPMNALFFQDGSHPSPIFAAHAPPKPEVVAPEAPVARVESVKSEAAAPTPVAKRNTAAKDKSLEDEIAALAAEPVAKTTHIAPKPEPVAKPAAAKPAVAKPAAVKPAPAATKPAPAAAAKAAPPPAKPVVAAKTETPKAAAAKPAKAPTKTAAAAAKPEESRMSDLIGHLLRGGEPKR